MPSKSKAQQSAAALALQAKRGDIPVNKLRGASKEMYDSMSEEELKDYAETSRKNLPDEVSEGIRRHHVDEDVEIVLNGERYVLEEGDEIVIKDVACKECGTVFMEKLSSFNYTLPKDKEALLYDFYMSTYLQETGDIDIDAAIQDMKSELYPSLQTQLLDAVFFAICAEVRHVFDRESYESVSMELNKSEARKLKEYLVLYTTLQGGAIDQHSLLGSQSRVNRRLITDDNKKSYINSYRSALRAFKNRSSFVKMSLKLFSVTRFWNNQFGGDKWVQICKGWLKLYEVPSSNLQSLMIYIDHVYDLQHNTDTVLNKVKSYYKSGYSWIREALEHKKHIVSPYELFDKISLSMKRLAGFAVKAQYGTTLQQWAEAVDDDLEIEEPDDLEVSESCPWKDPFKDFPRPWKDGTWKDGVWKNGVWKNGVWKRGIWVDGIWKTGTWEGGTWHNGTWKNGIWKRGIWVDGIWKRGIWKTGTWEGGTWYDGHWYNGTWKDGVWKNGTWKNGIWMDGIWVTGLIYDPDRKGNFQDDWEWKGDFVHSPISPRKYWTPVT